MYSGYAQSSESVLVTQFVPIAAVKTVEVHTPDLKKQTSPKMEKLFSSTFSRRSGYFLSYEKTS